jgi:hypothetical protein
VGLHKKDGTRDKGTELLIMNYNIQEEIELKRENKLTGEFFDNE